jgi:nucleoside-diphosphate-sugar epimerase
MRYLVTGGQGFVGRYLTALLLESGDTNVFTIGRSGRCDDCFTHSVSWGDKTLPAPLPGAIKHAAHAGYRQIDVTDTDALATVIREIRPDIVFHLASGLRGDSPASLFPTNVLGTISLLQAISNARIFPRVVVASSGSVYGEQSQSGLPVTEAHRCTPKDLYAVSKLASEQSAAVVSVETGIPVIFARVFNIVGAGQEERHVCGRWASQFAQIVCERAPRRVSVGSMETTRDFIDVRDVAKALLLLGEQGTVGETYNVASGEETAIRDVFDSLLDIANLGSDLEQVASESVTRGVSRQVADIERIRSLGFEPSQHLRESLAAVFCYYVEDVREAVHAIHPPAADRSGARR